MAGERAMQRSAMAEAAAEIGLGLKLLLRIDDAAERDSLELRSEEHTSELQSLMRISYAVFCLKKKKKTHQPKISSHTPQRAINIHPTQEYIKNALTKT